MDEDRATGSLRDDVGREVERMLAVEPAPWLKVQVRARIDRERAAHAGAMRWRLVGVGACALAVVAVLGVLRQRAPDLVRPPQGTVAIPAATPPRTTASEEAMSQPEPTTLPTQTDGSRRRAAQPGPRTAELEVPPLDDGPQSAPLESPSEITIEPIAIEPLARLESIEGERQ